MGRQIYTGDFYCENHSGFLQVSLRQHSNALVEWITGSLTACLHCVKTESLRISSICSRFDQHLRDNQPRVPNRFNLIVRLRLYQEQDRL